MNDSGGRPPLPEKRSLHPYPGTVSATIISSQPKLLAPVRISSPLPAAKTPVKANSRKNHTLHKDALFILTQGEYAHVISEDYSYKTDSYYTILRMEMEGKRVKPSSSAVIDAFVVPICLERAKIAGIPVCKWEISQAYVPLPAILYGINYFADSSEFVTVYDNEAAKEAVRHITNKGKYPFCYQELGDGAEIFLYNVIFGKTISPHLPVIEMAMWVYDLFAIPLMQMVLVRMGNTYSLSSLSFVRYSQLQEGERTLLEAHISHQEFL
ncbi:MAG: hypothetical protein WCH85_04175 [Methanomicrobiales archaeon]